MVGREKKWRQLAQRPQFSPHSGAKTNDKKQNLRKNDNYWYK